MEIQNHLDAMPRAWVPADHDLKNTIFSHDGSIEGYSGVCHAHSQSNNDQSFCSRIACARCKLSSLDVGDNELSGALLAAKMAEQTLDDIPEIPTTMVATFLGDSQCTSYVLDPKYVQKDRRRRHRTMQRIQSKHPTKLEARVSCQEQIPHKEGKPYNM